MTEAATKQPGKIQQLFGLWQKAGDGELLPRAFAIGLAVAEGINETPDHHRTGVAPSVRVRTVYLMRELLKVAACPSSYRSPATPCRRGHVMKRPLLEANCGV